MHPNLELFKSTFYNIKTLEWQGVIDVVFKEKPQCLREQF